MTKHSTESPKPAATLSWQEFKTMDQQRGGDKASVAHLTLSRPHKANAFDKEMMCTLIDLLDQVSREPSARLLVVRAEGEHFSAGADLSWMKSSAQLSYAENIEDASLLDKLFRNLKTLPIPTLGIVQGSVFGGGVGLVACLDTVIALQGSRWALSEVKLGLAPAVIMPYLFYKMRPGSLRTYALTGQIFTANEALESGLVTHVATPQDGESLVQTLGDSLLNGSPQAQREIKHYLNQMEFSGISGAPDLGIQLIARLRTSPEGQAGLLAFFNKAPPPWKIDIHPSST